MDIAITSLYLRHNAIDPGLPGDRAKEYVVDPTMLLTAFGGFGSAVSAGNTLGGAVTSPGSTSTDWRIGSWAGGVAGTASGVVTGSAAVANLVASSAAATAQTAATAAQGMAEWFQGVKTGLDLAGADVPAQIAADVARSAQEAATAQAQADAAAASAKKSKWPAPILIAANIIHVAQNMLNGFGAPNKGDILETAAGRLDLAAKDLTMAANTTGWTNDDGGAEAKYSEGNQAQQERVKKMAAIDRDFNKALTKQAGQVADIRGAFGYVTAVYAVAIPACGALTASGQEKVSLGIQTAIALTCASADTAAQVVHRSNVVANGNVIQGLATQYQDLETAATAYLTEVNNACCPHNAAQTTTP